MSCSPGVTIGSFGKGLGEEGLTGFSFGVEEEKPKEGPKLLPNGILNEEEGVIRDRQNEANYVEGEGAKIMIRNGLPKDITSRELAGLFFFSKGYLDSQVIYMNGSEVGAIVQFESLETAITAKEFLNGKVLDKLGSPLSVDIVPIFKRTSSSSSVSSYVQKNYPSATLSSSSKSSSKSSGSSASSHPHHPQTSRFAQYCSSSSNIKNNDLMNSFYGITNTFSLPMMENTADNAWSPASPGFSYSSLGVHPVTNPPVPSANNTISESVHKNTPINENMEEWRFQQQYQPAENANESPSQPPVSRLSNSLVVNMQNMSPNGSSYVGSNVISPNRHKSAVQNHRFSQNNNALSSIASSSSGHSSLMMSPQASHFVPSSPNGFVNSPKIQSHVVGLNGMQVTDPSNHSYYMNSSFGYGYPNHFRGSIPFSTNPADQNPPCNTLYVGNLPLSTSEDELRNLFSRQPGYRRLCYRTKSNGPMCFVEFEDVGYAMKALSLLQGVCLSSSVKGGIRLSFSKNPLGVRSNANPNLLVNHYGMHNNGFSPSIHTHSGFSMPSWSGMNQQLLGK
ncbi:hypothetical protein T552_01203 [Pneumocystis carinii B80]|uniref:RRM domain-containing protein n=1 Tax=Pneumocystis carinii (strain B80) TaxID=1408658 RepID=A0A0W4ZLK7_PNEC8|nr:hypothetical protein T552_01203 [Pneumocystis carinii B80]KTW29247.1 hypothetical protein T552_01203 [Pneumocystis carinii B80]